MNEPTDQEVMMQVQGGDVGQLSVLFERYHRRIFNYCLRLTRNRETSQDLVQDVFFRILKYRETYRGDQAFAPWMYRMARNASIDHLRKSGREVPHDDDFEWEDPAPAPLPVEELTHREDLQRLRDALHRLPVQKREILVLARFGSMKYEEIAQSLDCSVGAVKVRVHRALKQLKDVYWQMANEAAS